MLRGLFVFFRRVSQPTPEERFLMYVAEMTTRKYSGKINPRITGPDDVLALLKKYKRAEREHFLVLLLNTRHDCMLIEVVSVGSLNASIVHPREVFKHAVMRSAASVILVHNHPSGDPEPSEEDISITQRLVKAGEILGIAVIDHVIIASRGNCSLRATGRM
jgi:DNA repair protein RadC